MFPGRRLQTISRRSLAHHYNRRWQRGPQAIEYICGRAAGAGRGAPSATNTRSLMPREGPVLRWLSHDALNARKLATQASLKAPDDASGRLNLFGPRDFSSPELAGTLEALALTLPPHPVEGPPKSFGPGLVRTVEFRTLMPAVRLRRKSGPNRRKNCSPCRNRVPERFGLAGAHNVMGATQTSGWAKFSRPAASILSLK